MALIAADDALYNPRLRRRYPIVDGVPQLLPASGEQVSAEEHERLLARMQTVGGTPGAAGSSEGEGRP
nr:Trm112 family protein [Streptomyces niger]